MELKDKEKFLQEIVFKCICFGFPSSIHSHKNILKLYFNPLKYPPSYQNSQTIINLNGCGKGANIYWDGISSLKPQGL